MSDICHNDNAFDLDAEIRRSAEALAEFEEAMRQVSKDHAVAPTLTDRRGAIVAALTAVNALMVKIDMVPYVGPIFEIAMAICAIDKGKALPIVQAASRQSHAPKFDEGIWLQRAVIAASLEQRFRTTDAKLHDAATEVARWLTGLAIVGNTKNVASAIKKWREDMNARRPDELPRRVFDHYRREIGDSPRAYLAPLTDQGSLRRELEIWGVGTNPKNP